MRPRKKTMLNLIVGLGSEAIVIILGVIIPRLTLTSYGSEVNGLLSSVTQLFAYVALLEAGIGTASLQALYKVVGKNDHNRANSILAATHRYYRRVGVFYSLAIIALSIVYPLVVQSNISKSTIFCIIMIYGFGNVIKFFFQGKYFILLQAEGKNYIQNGLNLTSSILKDVSKIILMRLGADVLWVQVSVFLVSCLQMAIVSLYIHKGYKWVDLSVKPDYEAISQSKNVFIHQISGLIFNNTDVLILTYFLGLKTVSVYSLYATIYGMVGSVVATLATSIIFRMGALYNENIGKYRKAYSCYENYYMAVVFSLFTVTAILIKDFLRLYTAGVNDIQYVDKYLPILFSAVNILSYGRSAAYYTLNFSEQFKATQHHAIIESCLNLSISLIGVNFIGIYGVVMGTIAALLFRAVIMTQWANNRVLKQSAFQSYKRWFINSIVASIVVFFLYDYNFLISSYLDFLVAGAVLTVCITFLFLLTDTAIDLQSAKNIIKHLKMKD